MIRILGGCSSLVHLHLRDVSARVLRTKAFLPKFTYNRSSAHSEMPLLAPRLKTIKVDYDPPNFDMLALADALQSRVTLDGISRKTRGSRYESGLRVSTQQYDGGYVS
jgi:hypothetical protein